jgi:hypothetical protein
VLPSRSGRNGQGFTHAGPINLRNARHAEDDSPLDERCTCDVCAHYSRAYLHHLHKSGEILGAMLLTEHNLAFYQQLMAGMRAAIAQDRFAAFAADFRRDYLQSAARPSRVCPLRCLRIVLCYQSWSAWQSVRYADLGDTLRFARSFPASSAVKERPTEEVRSPPAIMANCGRVGKSPGMVRVHQSPFLAVWQPAHGVMSLPLRPTCGGPPPVCVAKMGLTIRIRRSTAVYSAASRCGSATSSRVSR